MTMSGDLTNGMRSPLPEPQANLGYLFRLAFQRFRNTLEDELTDVWLSAQEYGVLSLFETRSELSTSELARLAQVTRQTMHAVVLGLETAGVVERRSRNRRVVLVSLTEQGRERLEAATERVRAVERAAMAGLSDEQERTVREWLAAVGAPELNG
jgi:DNA-binding MarR family transcriptional regulator